MFEFLLEKVICWKYRNSVCRLNSEDKVRVGPMVNIVTLHSLPFTVCDKLWCCYSPYKSPPMSSLRAKQTTEHFCVLYCSSMFYPSTLLVLLAPKRISRCIPQANVRKTQKTTTASRLQPFLVSDIHRFVLYRLSSRTMIFHENFLPGCWLIHFSH